MDALRPAQAGAVQEPRGPAGECPGGAAGRATGATLQWAPKPKAFTADDLLAFLRALPPYSPELNSIEPVFRLFKHQEMPERRYPMVADLTTAIDTAFSNYRSKLHAKSLSQLGLPA